MAHASAGAKAANRRAVLRRATIHHEDLRARARLHTLAMDFPVFHLDFLNNRMLIPLVAYLERRGEEAHFCQISDSTTSYGSYSGATPNEKITWDKLTEETPMFVIESDATIVVPLMLTALLECARDPSGAARVIVENA